jgi:transcriptional regulator with XRE-family HTH domain/tetratricopeptide (TPR) repeat protein
MACGQSSRFSRSSLDHKAQVGHTLQQSGKVNEDGPSVLGRLLRQARERAWLSQQQLAEQSGLSVRTISNVESGRISHPRSQSVQLLADALGLAADERAAFERVAAGTDLRPLRVPSLSDPPCLLPPDVADFTGRDAEVQELMELLSRPDAAKTSGTSAPIIVLAGQGGVGKTALAVHVAHLLRSAFHDGQLFVDMRADNGIPLNPSEVLARFLRACGVDYAQIPLDSAERAEMFRATVANKRMLIVLDNVASESQVRPLIPGTPGDALLVTTRMPLTSLWGARTLRLSILTEQAAVRLLERMLGQHRADAEQKAARQIIRHCGYLPLALRIVGARLALHPSLTLAAMAESLSNERARLDELTVGDLSIRASMSLSYRDLTDNQRLAFRLLGSVDHEEFAAWIASPLLDIPIQQAEALVDELVHAQFLQNVGPDATRTSRFRFHDLARLYARQESDAEDDDQSRGRALRRLAESWLTLAEKANAKLPVTSDVVSVGSTSRGPLPAALVDKVLADATTWLDIERHNLIAAVEAAAAADLGEVTWEIAGCMTSYLLLRGHYQSWDRVHQASLISSRRIGDRRGEAASLTAISWNYHHPRIDEARSIPWLKQALSIFEEIGDTRGQTKTLIVLSETLIKQGMGKSQHSFSEAAAYAMAALDALMREPNDELEADALIALATARLSDHKSEIAEGLLRRALEMTWRLGAFQGHAVVLWRLAQLARGRGDAGAADDLLKRALAQVRDLGDHHGQARLLLELARSETDRENFAEAKRLVDDAVNIAPRYTSVQFKQDLGTLTRFLDTR